MGRPKGRPLRELRRPRLAAGALGRRDGPLHVGHGLQAVPNRQSRSCITRCRRRCCRLSARVPGVDPRTIPPNLKTDTRAALAQALSAPGSREYIWQPSASLHRREGCARSTPAARPHPDQHIDAGRPRAASRPWQTRSDRRLPIDRLPTGAGDRA